MLCSIRHTITSTEHDTIYCWQLVQVVGMHDLTIVLEKNLMEKLANFHLEKSFIITFDNPEGIQADVYSKKSTSLSGSY